MTYKPTSAPELIDLLIAAKTMPLGFVQAAAANGGTGGLSANPMQISQFASSGITGARDSSGSYNVVSTGAAIDNYAIVYETVPGVPIREGPGLIVKFAITAVTDGKGFFGYIDNSNWSSAIPNSNGLLVNYASMGVGYDKALGHTNWQFINHATDSTPPGPIFVDSGIPIVANTPLIMIADCLDKSGCHVEILDASGTILASHDWVSTDLPSSSTVLYGGIGIATPHTGTPAARSLRYYASNHWRRP